MKKVARIQRQMDFALRYWPEKFKKAGLDKALTRRMNRLIQKHRAVEIQSLSPAQTRALKDIRENGGPSKNHPRVVGAHGAALEAVHEKLQEKGLINENLKPV